MRAAFLALVLGLVVGLGVSPLVAQPRPGQGRTFIQRVSLSANTTTPIVTGGLVGRVVEWACSNTDAADAVHLVDEGDTDLTDSYGPFCPVATCTDFGGTASDETGQAWFRSASAAVLLCRFKVQ